MDLKGRLICLDVSITLAIEEYKRLANHEYNQAPRVQVWINSAIDNLEAIHKELVIIQEELEQLKGEETHPCTTGPK